MAHLDPQLSRKNLTAAQEASPSLLKHLHLWLATIITAYHLFGAQRPWQDPKPASPQTRLVSEMKQGAIPRTKEKKMLCFGVTQQTILGTIGFLFRVCISPSFYLACCNSFLNEVPTPPAPAPFQKFITTWRSWAVVQIYSTRVSESGSPDEHI